MKVVYVLIVLLVITSCKNDKKSEFTKADKINSFDLLASESHPGKKIMEIQCYACHDATTTEENRLGPPMAAIKRRYLKGGQTKNEFINDIMVWITKPSLEKSKMPGAVDRFGVMPYLPVPEESIQQIAEYIYDYDIEQPEWFEEHYQKNHASGKGKGKGMGKGKGKGKGMGKQQRFGQNKTVGNYSDIGLKYALSTKAQLGKNLIKAIEEKGTAGAVEFCDNKAMKLTDSMSVIHNAIIKRVSDKARNPGNMANAKELGHIETFKEMVKTGSDIYPIVEEIEGEVKFYYPITTNAMCLQCHGSPDEHISKATLRTLNKLYPNDQATGYDLGQVRGIWSINFEASSIK